MSVDVNQLFQSWAKKSSCSVPDLEKEYKERWDKSAIELPELQPEDRKKYVLSLIQTSLKRQLASPAKKYIGYFIGYSGVQDAHYWDKTQAKEKGHVNEEGEAVWKGHRFFKDGEVISERMTRRYYGICAVDDGKSMSMDDFRPFVLYNDNKPDMVPKLFERMSFRANGKDPNPNFTLTAASVTDFKETGGPNPPSALEFLEHYFPKNICPKFSDMKNFNPKEDGAPFPLFMVKGIVGDIRFRDNNGAIIELGSPELETDLSAENPNLTCFTDPSMPVPFAVGSAIIAIGQPNRDRTNMSVFGLVEVLAIRRPENLQEITKNNASVPDSSEDEYFGGGQ